MRRFLKDESGSALILSLFIILILFTLSFVIYSGVAVYAKYQMCENELQRASIVTADKSMENANVRDLQIDIPAASAESSLEDNLIQSGWTREGENWAKHDGDKTLYSLENMNIEISGRTMQINATFAMQLPWSEGDLTIIRIPMQIRASILYVD